jgi:molecular chaperone IbpA
MTQFEIRTLDLSTLAHQLHRQSIGFDRMFDELHRTLASAKQDNYPPHNVVKIDDINYVIELAVAGFSEDEIAVELTDNILTVSGEKAKSDVEVEYLHKGISARNFVRTFPLAEHVQVTGATANNGILSISLAQIVPEEKKPKKIAISFQK